MLSAGWMHRGQLAGALLLLVGLPLAGSAFAALPAGSNAAQLLAHADAIKTVDNNAFSDLLDQLDQNKSALSASQRWQLQYLRAWEIAYRGEYAKAKPLLETVMQQAPIDAVRMHAAAALVNILGYTHHYEEAYQRLDQALDQLPKVSDRDARFHVLGEASQLLSGAGQYDLASSYAAQIIADYPGGRNGCIGRYLKGHADFLGGHMQAWREHAKESIAACLSAGENLFADSTRRDIANLDIREGRPADAVALLEKSYLNVVKYRYLELTAEYDALLAQAYWQLEDDTRADEFALKTLDAAQKSEFMEPLTTAYQLLYQIERQRSNLREALVYHEKYMAADKGRMDDVREKALAYQFVRQQVEAKKVELDELNKRNQLLKLHQALDHQAVETSRLYIALLLTVLASIALWLYRLKRSQLRFMRLARRDGLTGIFNRQHFVEEAEQSLRYVAKSQRGAALILIDLDHFKNINDTYGHIAGDSILKRAVATCQKHLHSCDVFGRIGGEEFGILLPECTLLQALERAEHIRTAIQATADDETPSIALTASFGVAATAQHGYDLRRLLAAADSALYRAKRDGRNRVVISMNEQPASPSPDEERSSSDGATHYAGPTS